MNDCLEDTIHQSTIDRALGAGETGEEKRLLLGKAAATPVALYHCPSRRPAIGYPFFYGSYRNAELPSNGTSKTLGKIDYGACSGDWVVFCPGGTWPPEIGDDPNYQWWAPRDGPPDGWAPPSGVSFWRSEVKPADVTDGLSNTYFVGESYLNPDHYFDGRENCEYGWNQGAEVNGLYRWTYQDRNFPESAWAYGPMQDRAGFVNCAGFGSAHSGGWNAVFCDGTVRLMPYAIDREVHARLGNRKDGLFVDANRY